jgi:c(7)-type cytochrome triheme protein
MKQPFLLLWAACLLWPAAIGLLPDAAAQAPAAAAAPAPPASGAAKPQAPTLPAGAEVNAFNRLLKPLGRINRPAAESGIHDPANDATLQLQPPADAFITLPKSNAGNHVDWVKALDSKAIAPRWDRNDPKAAAVVMDLNIVREVKGSMPDVVYPHKQHTEWLDCSNCHPSIFIPQKGANQISMASILLGQKCGVCHGKVAFPVSECRLCHSRKKSAAVAALPASGAKP